MSCIISIEDFISRSAESHIIDVRSESEYKQGHFPGAVNIPILNDEHRKEVGTIYKQKGRQEAIIKGLDLAAPKFGDFIRQVKNITEPTTASGKSGALPANGQFIQRPVHSKWNDGGNFNEDRLPAFFLYCWRGGMRSEIADCILTFAGFKVLRLKGGYKSFRKWAFETLNLEKKILVLGGMTGSGKTELLQQLSKLAETVIDLEQLAHHKGSAFGGLGQLPQPTNEHFENMLALEWAKIPNVDDNKSSRPQIKFAWLENESRTIGHNQLPNSIYEQIRKASVVEINIPREKRIHRILNEYGKFPLNQLEEMTKKLKKRLGGQHLKESLDYLTNGDFENWAKKMLDYYDKAYSYGMSQRTPEAIHSINLNGKSYFEMAKLVSVLGNNVMKKINQKELSF